MPHSKSCAKQAQNKEKFCQNLLTIFLGFFSCVLKWIWYNVDMRVRDNKRENQMNIETDHIIRLLTSLFNEREKESVMSMAYAKLTVDILQIEKILAHRGVDVGQIFSNLTEM
jgi:hypothetical protein